MTFISPWFLGGLCVLFVLYYTLPKRAQWPLLLLASLGFYALAGWAALAAMLVTVAASYGIAMHMSKLKIAQKAHVAQHRDSMTRDERKAYNAAQKRRQRGWLIAGLLFNFSLLAAVKIGEALARIDIIPSMIFFVGISYYMFRICGYLIDVFWGKIEVQRNPLKLALFTIFFPYAMIGPISRYHNVADALLNEKRIDWALFGRGLQRMIWGFFKVMVVGFRLLLSINHLRATPGEYSGMFAFFTMLVWGAYLYADFSGAIDISIGIAMCFGIRVEENFISPFRARDIFDYWRRWHITMGTWFRDYVFYPLSVAKFMQKWPTRVKIHIATAVTWFTTGIWHGVAWNFIVWGLSNGVVIMISQELKPLYERFNKRFSFTKTKVYTCFAIVRTFLLLTLIRAFDIYFDVPLTFRHFASFITNPQFGAFFRYFGEHEVWFGLAPLEWLVAALGIAVMIAVPWFRKEEKRRPPAIFWAALVLVIFIFGMYGLGFDMQDFFYMQF
ncbi:MAG: hypothetical protein FWD06_08740 [Oscillospiraceae bacterium]|nr:hypothetical protein [Oscillospiraceae bacterium]